MIIVIIMIITIIKLNLQKITYLYSLPFGRPFLGLTNSLRSISFPILASPPSRVFLLIDKAQGYPFLAKLPIACGQGQRKQQSRGLKRLNTCYCMKVGDASFRCPLHAVVRILSVIKRVNSFKHIPYRLLFY